jgi:hypothetical protein
MPKYIIEVERETVDATLEKLKNVPPKPKATLPLATAVREELSEALYEMLIKGYSRKEIVAFVAKEFGLPPSKLVGPVSQAISDYRRKQNSRPMLVDLSEIEEG